MVSRRNRELIDKYSAYEVFRYAIRKFTFGAASVLLGVGLALVGSSVVSAEEGLEAAEPAVEQAGLADEIDLPVVSEPVAVGEEAELVEEIVNRPDEVKEDISGKINKVEKEKGSSLALEEVSEVEESQPEEVLEEETIAEVSEEEVTEESEDSGEEEVPKDEEKSSENRKDPSDEEVLELSEEEELQGVKANRDRANEEERVTDPANYPQVPFVPKSEYIFAQYDLTDAKGTNYDFRVTFTADRETLEKVKIYVTARNYVSATYPGHGTELSVGGFKSGTYANYYNDQDAIAMVTKDGWWYRNIYEMGTTVQLAYENWTSFKPKRVEQVIHYYEEGSKEEVASSEKLIGITGQEYYAKYEKVADGYYLVEEPNDLEGKMSPYKEGFTQTEAYHDKPGMVIDYEQIDAIGNMRIQMRTTNPFGRGFRTEFVLAPGQESDVIQFRTADGDIWSYSVSSPYIESHTSIDYYYKKLGSWKVTNPDDTTTSTIYPNDPENPREIDGDVESYAPIPYIKGYTPVIDGVALNPIDPYDPTKGYRPNKPDQYDKDIHITHQALEQKATIVYKEQDGERTSELQIDALTGLSNQASDYTPEERIQSYINQGYEVISNSFPTDGLVFDDDVDVDQTFEVILEAKETTFTPDEPGTPGEPLNPNVPEGLKVPELEELRRMIKQTVHYVDEEGKEATASIEETLVFERTATVNHVTGEVAYSDWMPVTSDTFKEVPSPEVPGKTPLEASVEAKQVTAESSDIVETILYMKDEEPQIQSTADVVYRDTDGNILAKDTLIGNVGERETEYTTDALIEEQVNKGYKIFNDGYESGFTHTEEHQIFEVIFEPKTSEFTSGQPGIPGEPLDPEVPEGPKVPDTGLREEDLRRTIKQTINYVDEEGKVVADLVEHGLIFERTATINHVTGEIIYSDWAPVTDNTFGEVKSPSVENMTPDRTSIEEVEITPDSNDIVEEIIYRKDKAQARVIYKDAEGKVLDEEDLNGFVGESEDSYKTDDTIKKYENLGYKVTKDEYERGFEYTKEPQTFAVTLEPKISKFTPDNPGIPGEPLDSEVPNGPKVPDTGLKEEDLRRIVKRTINYVDEDGKVLADPVERELVFERTATVNHVTGEVAYGDWQAVAAKTFEEVVSPSIERMTPDRTSIDRVEVTPESKDIVEKVVYTKDFAEATVIYKDAEGKVLEEEDLTGDIGESEDTYKTDDTIKKYENLGYKVTKDGYEPGFEYTQDPQAFEVVLEPKEALFTPDEPGIPGDPLDPNVPDGPKVPELEELRRTVKETINYVDEEGRVLADPVERELVFERTAIVNHVTREITYGNWAPVTVDTFEEVSSPEIEGMTPLQASVEAKQVTAESSDIVEDVLYMQDREPQIQSTADVVYRDKDGNILAMATLIGNVGDKETEYTTEQVIKEQENKGYKVATDRYEPGFIHTEEHQTFEVIFEPKMSEFTSGQPGIPGDPLDPEVPDGPKVPDTGLKEEDLRRTVKQIISYIDEAGKALVVPVKRELTFERTATINHVTGEITYGEWEAVDGDTFGAVTSPEVEGMTPLQGSVDTKPVTAESSDIIEEVLYTKDGEPQTQSTVDIVYKDKAGNILATDTLIGNVGERETGYTTEQLIKEQENKGYKIVTDGYEPGFTHTEEHQIFEVIFEPKVSTFTPDEPGTPGDPLDPEVPEGPKVPDTGLREEDLRHIVKQTINYVDEDGKVVADPVGRELVFERTATINHVTGEITYGEWRSATGNAFGEVTSPSVENMTPDRASIEEVEVTPDSDDIVEEVVYRKEVPSVEGNAIVIYEDMDGNTLDKEDLTGQLGETEEGYTTEDTIKELKNKGYKLETDGYTPGFEYTEDPQTFRVILKAKETTFRPGDPRTPGDPLDPEVPDGPKVPDTGLREEDLRHIVKQTINYVDEEGKVVADPVERELVFERTATINHVTGEITYGDWTAVTGNTFAEVISPSVENMTPDRASVDKVEVTPASKDIVETVTYKEDPQVEPNATIIYQDINGNLLGEDFLFGRVGSKETDYTTEAIIKHFAVLGYQLVTDGYTPGFEYTEDPQTFEVTLEPKTSEFTPDKLGKPGEPLDPNVPDGPKVPEIEELRRAVKETINYVDEEGKVVADPIEREIVFERTATINHVTGEIIYSDWTSVTGDTFEAETSPEVEGMTPDRTSVDEVTVTEDSDDIVEEVVYSKDEVPSIDGNATVIYKDTDGNTLDKEDLTGQLGETEEGYTTEDIIKELENKGYKLVTDGYTPGFEYTEDPRTFEVILEPKISEFTPETPGRPGDPLDPEVPEGPKVPELEELSKTVTQTIKYVDENGEEVASPIERKVVLERKATVNHVTGEVTYSDWTIDTFDSVKSPIVPGYYADKSSTEAVDVTYESDDDDQVIVYRPLGNLVPNVPGSEPVPYPNDPEDPTQPGQPIIPEIPGYSPTNPEHVPGEPYPIDPTQPGEDTPIEYEKDKTPTPEDPKPEDPVPGVPIPEDPSKEDPVPEAPLDEEDSKEEPAQPSEAPEDQPELAKGSALPETGELGQVTFIGTAAFALIAGLGLVVTPRRREEE